MLNFKFSARPILRWPLCLPWEHILKHFRFIRSPMCFYSASPGWLQPSVAFWHPCHDSGRLQLEGHKLSLCVLWSVFRSWGQNWWPWRRASVRAYFQTFVSQLLTGHLNYLLDPMRFAISLGLAGQGLKALWLQPWVGTSGEGCFEISLGRDEPLQVLAGLYLLNE